MPDYGIGSWPWRRARIDGAATALRQGARGLSYGELAARVDRLAHGLAGLGVGRGHRVAYLGRNDLATFEVFFAAGRLGAVFAPFNVRLTADELGFLVDDAAPTVLVHAPDLAGVVGALDPQRCGVAAVLEVGAETSSYEQLIAAAPGGSTGAEVSLDDDAVILYTSGTTGRPKGAVLTHGNLTFNTMNQLAHADVLSSDIALCTAPLFHATGLGQVSLPVLFKGGSVIIAPTFDPAWMLAAIGEHRIATFSAVPTMLQLLCDHPDFAAADLSSLRYVIYGGSMVTERVALAWQRRGVDILQGYGMTEASPGVMLATPAGARDRPVSMGVPHFFTDIALAPRAGEDAAPVEIAPAGEAPAGETPAGELLVRGLNVFRGYWHRPDATAAALADGWFHSGDVVRVEDGWGYVVDRIKDMIISGGENVYPAEVEAAIGRLPGVVEAAVVAVADEKWGEAGLAYVVTAEPNPWTEQSLRAALAATLAKFKIPAQVRFVADLPHTATGKIRKSELRTDREQP